MGCSGCKTRTLGGLPAGCRNNGACATKGCGDKLDVYDWLSNVYYYDEPVTHPIIEVKFKGTRKEYFRNAFGMELNIGDLVVVESATAGWDAGTVSLTGELVKLQLRKHRIDENSDMMRRVLRHANEYDLQKYDEGKNLEQETMIRARQIAIDLGLSMKISDVEYQGDRAKATFFYTAEGRVDFRELIKALAREFKVKIEMRQIGLRQEAGRLGGIGSCGRELCCSTWLTDFHSVPTTAARYQNLFLNPLKLSGQCGRLKCCLNYELDVYVEALNEFPEENTVLKTEKGLARVEKLDILKRIMWFRYQDEIGGKFYPLEVSEVKRLLELNEQGISATDLEEYQAETELPEEEMDFKDTVGEERLDRFDRSRKKKKKKGPQQRGGGAQAQQKPGPQGQGEERRQQEGQPRGQQPQGGQPRGDRRRDERPRQERPQGQQDQQQGQRPQGQPKGERQQGQPRGERPQGQPKGERPQGQPKGEGRPQGQPRGERPQGQPRPEGQKPQEGQRRERGPRPEQQQGQGQEGGQPRPPRENRPPRNEGQGQQQEGAPKREGRENRDRNNRQEGGRPQKQQRPPKGEGGQRPQRPGIHNEESRPNEGPKSEGGGSNNPSNKASE